MISLLLSIFIGWLLLRWLWPRTDMPICIEPPAPQIVIHVHSANVLIQPPHVAQSK
jgi:hypothetical protein